MVRRQAQPSQLALGRHCAQPTSRPGEGRESRGPEAGSDRHSWPEPTLCAAVHAA